MTKTISVFAAFFFFTMGLNAQFGIKLGANLANWNSSALTNFGEFDTKVDFGPMFGLFYNANLDEYSSIRVSTLYSVKGPGIEDEFIQASYDLAYLDLNVDYYYKVSQSENFSTSILAGPYFAYALKGFVNIDDEREEIELTKDNGFNRIDFGMNLGVNLNYQNFEFQLTYGLGVGNLVAEEEGLNDFRVSNRNFTISLGYLFGSQKIETEE